MVSLLVLAAVTLPVLAARPATARREKAKPAAGPVAQLARGYQAFTDGNYGEASRALDDLAPRLPRNRDYVLFLAGESAFYDGRPQRARALFEELARDRASRLSTVAAWRAADSQWAEGRRGDAVAAYRKLLATDPPPAIDAAVARFRVAETADGDERRRLFRQVHVEHPAHPLSAEAARRAGPTEKTPPGDRPPAATDARGRLKRASVLADKLLLAEANAELEALGSGLPADLAAERDFQLGMVKFRTRREYPAAATLLLGVAPRLDGERASFAAFHGARALLRAGREDHAIAAYQDVVQRYPGSRWALEAQFVAGWIQFNRGRYADSVPGLRAALAQQGRGSNAKGAAWYLALAHHFQNRHDDALAALEEYARLAGREAEAARRVSYWRGRFLDAKGDAKGAREAWQDLVRREPLSYYALLARARLRKAGVRAGVELPRADEALPKPSVKALRDPAVVRADELAEAGLIPDAAVELQRSEKDLEARLGRPQAMAVLLDRYGRYEGFRRAYQLAVLREGDALEKAPDERTRAIWEAAYPRAYEPFVAKHSKKARAPELFVYSIMHKETEFGPHRVSRADARGLMQLLPELGAEVAARLRMRFHPEDLYRPEVNIALGSQRLGELLKMFRGQMFLAAGAYNGGTRGVTRWLDTNGRRPLDEFIELVGFNDSREYMKRVSAIHARYVYLYTGKAPELPLTVNARYLPPPGAKKGRAPARAAERPRADEDQDEGQP